MKSIRSTKFVPIQWWARECGGAIGASRMGGKSTRRRRRKSSPFSSKREFRFFLGNREGDAWLQVHRENYPMQNCSSLSHAWPSLVLFDAQSSEFRVQALRDWQQSAVKAGRRLTFRGQLLLSIKRTATSAPPPIGCDATSISSRAPRRRLTTSRRSDHHFRVLLIRPCPLRN